jgi:hypothetical protein
MMRPLSAGQDICCCCARTSGDDISQHYSRKAPSSFAARIDSITFRHFAKEVPSLGPITVAAAAADAAAATWRAHTHCLTHSHMLAKQEQRVENEVARQKRRLPRDAPGRELVLRRSTRSVNTPLSSLNLFSFDESSALLSPLRRSRRKSSVFFFFFFSAAPSVRPPPGRPLKTDRPD